MRYIDKTLYGHEGKSLSAFVSAPLQRLRLHQDSSKAKGPYEVREVSSRSPRSLSAWGCPHADSCVGRVRLPAVTRQERLSFFLSSSWSCSTLFIKHPSNLRHARQSSSGIHPLFSFPTLISGHPSSLLRHSCGLWQESLPPSVMPNNCHRESIFSTPSFLRPVAGISPPFCHAQQLSSGIHLLYLRILAENCPL